MRNLLRVLITGLALLALLCLSTSVGWAGIIVTEGYVSQEEEEEEEEEEVTDLCDETQATGQSLVGTGADDAPCGDDDDADDEDDLPDGLDDLDNDPTSAWQCYGLGYGVQFCEADDETRRTPTGNACQSGPDPTSWLPVLLALLGLAISGRRRRDADLG